MSAASAWSAVPGAPTAVTAIGRSSQAVVSFTAPASNGGATITGYTVTASPGGATASGSSSPLSVTGLANGTAYTFMVTATNSAGTGIASSASVAAMPGDWAKSFGMEDSNVRIIATTVDAAGNVYATGTFQTATLTLGSSTLTSITFP